MLLQQVLAVALLVTVILTAVVAVGRAGIWSWRFLSRLNRLVDDLNGEPPRPGLPDGNPGVLDRMSVIEKHLRPLSSRLDGLEARLAALEMQVATLANPHPANPLEGQPSAVSG